MKDKETPSSWRKWLDDLWPLIFIAGLILGFSWAVWQYTQRENLRQEKFVRDATFAVGALVEHVTDGSIGIIRARDADRGYLVRFALKQQTTQTRVLTSDKPITLGYADIWCLSCELKEARK